MQIISRTNLSYWATVAVGVGIRGGSGPAAKVAR